MPYQLQLTWMPHAKRWRKRYRGSTYYMKTSCRGKKDRQGYEAALREWKRLKASIDGLGPSPYTPTGVLIPEDQLANVAPTYVPPTAVATVDRSNKTITKKRVPLAPQPLRSPDLPPWIQSVGVDVGLSPELIADNPAKNPYANERRISELAEFWLSQRHKQTERGELSLSQWHEDKTKLEVFRKFLRVNYPTAFYIDQIDSAMLNLYRDEQWDFVDCGGEHSIGKVTLRKRLAVVGKWLTWLVDQNILEEPPKDLRTYGRVKLDKPKPLFWSPDDVKTLANAASERTRLYVMLALNLGYTQKDIATLEAGMVDWDSGIVTRERHKTGVPSKGKLWPSTMALLQKHRNPKRSGPLLVGQNGLPLHVDKLNDKGNMVRLDAINLAFDRLKNNKKAGFKEDPRSFKHLRKSAANEIEKVRPELTELFLAHAEAGMKRHYVNQHFDELFAETDKLEALYGF